jgi:hypothetical protein
MDGGWASAEKDAFAPVAAEERQTKEKSDRLARAEVQSPLSADDAGFI